MECELVKDRISKKEIGAIGFINGKIGVVAIFYDDKDWNNDGKIDFNERFILMFSMKGRAFYQVINNARLDIRLYRKDPVNFHQLTGKAFLNLYTGLVSEGIYIAYFKNGISKSCGKIAATLANNTATKFVIREGMKQTVKKVYEASL